ncbi:MAG: DUF4349 domain-containing protein [Saprospiraceae bacterium]|nr:DUF4349 domain-containing protein [Saprospiraceae bacterium]
MKTLFPPAKAAAQWQRFNLHPLRLLTFCLSLSTFAWSCSGDAGGYSAKESAMQPYEDMELTEAESGAEYSDGNEMQRASAQAVAMERKIIKTADFRIKVKEVEESTKRIEEMVTAHEGFMSAVNLTNSTYRITNQLTIRVPANRFDELMNTIETESIFTDYRRVNAKDVTEEYLDIQTRLNTKKQVRDRYVAILRDKAKTVEEVLKAEEAIRVIQEEIESREGRLNYLKNRVALSTINLEIYQEVPYTPDRGNRTTFWTRLKQSAADGWTLVVSLVLGLVTIWPLVLIGALVIWRRKWLRKKLLGR